MRTETSPCLALAAALFATVASGQAESAPATEPGASALAPPPPPRARRLIEAAGPFPPLEQMPRAQLLPRRTVVEADRPQLWPWITMTVVGSVFVAGGLTVAIASGV